MKPFLAYNIGFDLPRCLYFKVELNYDGASNYLKIGASSEDEALRFAFAQSALHDGRKIVSHRIREIGVKTSDKWHTHPDAERFPFVVQNQHGQMIAETGQNVHIDPKEHRANAIAIAALPDLLKALQALVNGEVRLSDKSDRHLSEHDPNVIAARAAIAKAVGGAQ